MLLLVVGLAVWWPRRARHAAPAVDDSPDVAILEIRGMHCSSCVASVTRALAGVAGVTGVEVLLDEGTATVRGRGFSTDQAAAAVRSLGFEVVASG